MKIFLGLKSIAAIASVVIAASVIALFLHNTAEANIVLSEANNVPSDSAQKAIIIDQLYDDIPHEWFHEQASDLLKNAGYTVDIITTKDVTVDFYKTLPLQNYKIVIVRSHGVADTNEQNSVSLFSGERYTTDKYISEQLFGQVKKGAPLQEVDFLANGTDSQWVIVNDTYRTLTIPAKTLTSSDEEYFLITPIFVDTEMKGQFSNTIIILGGCSTMKTNSMAEALVKRGASLIVGWDDTVGSVENDFAMELLLEKLLVDNMPFEEAVDSTMNQIPIESMEYPARFVAFS
jgi:hypothetical protein